MARYGFLQDFEGDQPTGRAYSCLVVECLLAEKVAFAKIYCPFRSSLNWRRLLADIVPVQQVSHLQTQQISCSQTGRLETHAFAFLEEEGPKVDGLSCGNVQLIAQFSAITGSSDEAADAI